MFNRLWDSKPREVHLLDSAGMYEGPLPFVAKSMFLEERSRILWPESVGADGCNGLF